MILYWVYLSNCIIILNWLDYLEVEEREIQRGGRVTIPKSLRDRYGLKEGTVVRFRALEDSIEIEPPKKLTDLAGILKNGTVSDDPKKIAREYVRSRLRTDVE
jgi:AbrB family looped-hinge helix DNA binding protein